jgi:hypothetical protein
MTEPNLTDAEIRTLLDYARQRFAEERWPMSPALRPAREILAKLEANPEPLPPPKPWVNSTIGQRKRRR